MKPTRKWKQKISSSTRSLITGWIDHGNTITPNTENHYTMTDGTDKNRTKILGNRLITCLEVIYCLTYDQRNWKHHRTLTIPSTVEITEVGRTRITSPEQLEVQLPLLPPLCRSSSSGFPPRYTTTVYQWWFNIRMIWTSTKVPHKTKNETNTAIRNINSSSTYSTPTTDVRSDTFR